MIIASLLKRDKVYLVLRRNRTEAIITCKKVSNSFFTYNEIKLIPRILIFNTWTFKVTLKMLRRLLIKKISSFGSKIDRNLNSQKKFNNFILL